ncbi:aminoglycoside phosphotransferase family protein [Niabella yanshanensis]|uniref:Aminoglycoside phosphotransferase family protein n=1 Tax=Niabella yanshanensis TaxID=577386 RepID=A0ABZ0W8U6_9BACT|nr:aminoglycoside phosphotransferase family protein [Niabella yanshanensis]WQD39621.1 aminoglycoside phosphotransferase family protein [Niabella yanshanensis]
MDIMHSVLASYGFNRDSYTIERFGNGLINDTCLVKKEGDRYILQRINKAVFSNPLLIAENIEKIGAYLAKINTSYFFTTPCKTLAGDSIVCVEDGYYRMFPFVSGSHTIDVVQTPQQAFEAAAQFGQFTRVLSGMDIHSINITLPAFHDLALRYNQFLEALVKGNAARIAEVAGLVQQLKEQAHIVDEYNHILHDNAFRLRVTHHDTKISNVLFDEENKGLCVIDLDTVMPGYFISDVGDMMRTYLCPVSEEEKDYSKIEIREEFYFAIVNGYKTFMETELTDTEKQYFFYAGKFMIYMQALRFITDYINNDVYYGARYPGHNLVRATNQSILLQRLLEKEPVFSAR